MYQQKELIGKLLDSEIASLILNLKDINEKHTIGTTRIEYLDVTYDAQTVSQTLKVLETVAKENNLAMKTLTSESNLDELLGIGKAKEIEITATLKCWNLINSLTNEIFK